MKITEIRVTRGATINVGNYESRKIEYGLSAEIEDEGGEPLASVQALTEMVRSWVKQEVEQVRRAMEPKK